MKTIYKYVIKTMPVQQIEMPEGAEILCVRSQGDLICMWAEVDDDPGPTKDRVIAMYGTGHRIGVAYEDRAYVGTVQQGPYVWHVFELFTS